MKVEESLVVETKLLT